MGVTQCLPHIPHFTAAESEVSTGMSVTQFISLYSSLYPYNAGCYPIGYANRGATHGSDARRLGGPLSSGGIHFDSILILPALSILPCPRFYRFGIYPNPTYPIYPILSSTIWCRIQWIILILPALSILFRPRSYSIGVYPTYSIYHILSFRRPSGGESYGLDNNLAA